MKTYQVVYNNNILAVKFSIDEAKHVCDVLDVRAEIVEIDEDNLHW